MSNEDNNSTPLARLKEFVKWTQAEGLCKTDSDFERQCGLSAKYLANASQNSKGNVGAEMLGRIIRVFPQLNLVWVCAGKGQMLSDGEAVNADYKQAYEGAMMQIEALHRIIKQLYK